MGIGEILKVPQVCIWWPGTNISLLIQAPVWFWGSFSICCYYFLFGLLQIIYSLSCLCSI
uniref:Uncharacterized protein n=1 Tax=Salmo trutta TaxID=8032 RepID=A0A674F1L9_SALTR